VFDTPCPVDFIEMTERADPIGWLVWVTVPDASQVSGDRKSVGSTVVVGIGTGGRKGRTVASFGDGAIPDGRAERGVVSAAKAARRDRRKPCKRCST